METKARILIVDDDMDIINVLETILVHENYEVISANDKNEGLKLAKEQTPDLIISDVMMTTHYEGFEFAKEITESPAFKNTPVVMQTSIEVLTTTNPSVQQMAREYRKDPKYKELQVILIKDVNSGKAGIDYRAEDGSNVWVSVDGFLKKPVDSSNLLPLIDQLLTKKAQLA